MPIGSVTVAEGDRKELIDHITLWVGGVRPDGMPYGEFWYRAVKGTDPHLANWASRTLTQISSGFQIYTDLFKLESDGLSAKTPNYEWDSLSNATIPNGFNPESATLR